MVQNEEFVVVIISFKGTVSVISSDPPCKDENARIATNTLYSFKSSTNHIYVGFKVTVVNWAFLHEGSFAVIFPLNMTAL